MIGIIIVNYKKYELTIRCIESIEDTLIHIKYKIYVLDNDSQNNSYEILREKYQKKTNIQVIQTGSNMGYAKANNLGVKMAYKDNVKYCLISNNDIIYTDRSIDILYNFLNSNESSIIACPQILDESNVVTNSVNNVNITFKKHVLNSTGLSHFKLKSRKSNKNISCSEVKYPIEVSQFSGSCFMLNTEKFIKIGGFDENTFLYYEEYILSEKLKSINDTIVYLPDSKVIHFHGATTGRNNLFVKFEMLISEIYYFNKYKNVKKTALWLYFYIKSGKYLISSVINKNTKTFITMWIEVNKRIRKNF